MYTFNRVYDHYYFVPTNSTHSYIVQYILLDVNVNIIKVTSYPDCDDSFVSVSILGDDAIEGSCTVRLRSRL